MDAVDDEMVMYLRDQYRAEKRGDRMSVSLGPWTALMLVGTIQQVLSKPELAEHGPAMYRSLTDQLRLLFINDPIATRYIQQALD